MNQATIDCMSYLAVDGFVKWTIALLALAGCVIWLRKIIRSGILSSKSTDSGDGVITAILFSVVLFFFIIFFTVYVLIWHDWYWILTAPDSYLANHDTVCKCK